MANKTKDVKEIIPSKQVFVGNPDAQVTLTEFGEYENEDCAKANEVVKQLLEEYEGKVRFNFRHFPQTKIHQRSMKAAEASLAAAQTGNFWEMHNLLFENRRNLGTTSLKLYSKEAGVTNKHFLDDLINSTYGWEIRNDFQDGVDRGVKEVPAFFINGEPVSGKNSFENLSKEIDMALKKVKKKAPVKQRA
ncbi:MAG: thioredoxin domain-containing protein [Bacteroidetes bacterium]|nr:thioredoxin domain-containing protein [Bacteroidota bacterium]